MTQEPVEQAFEELYLAQRKRSSIFLATTVVLAITTVGSVAWALNSKSNTAVAEGPGNAQQAQGFGNSQGRPGGMRTMMDITSFFNEDGSVNTDQVKELMARMPSGQSDNSGFNFIDRIKENIDQAVSDGDITEDQANALLDAFEKEEGTVSET